MSDCWRRRIDEHVDAIADLLRSVRKHLHAHPEPSREEFATTEYLAARLAEAGIPHRVAPSGRGLVAGPGPDGPGPCVAFRADIDALRIQDAKDVPHRSTRPGVMHACGHDAHATMALGAALALHRAADALPGPFGWRAIFQPAEEVGEGALEMIAAGAVEGVDAILGLHVDPELDVGSVAHRVGVLTAFCQEVHVTIDGRGGHGARPHLTADPIAAAAQLIQALYQGLPRAVDPREPAVVSFGTIAGGASPNVIPDRVALGGTLRSLGRAEAARIRERFHRIARGVAEACDVEIQATFTHAMDAVVNEPWVTAAFVRAAAGVVGADRVWSLPQPSMGSEDFAAYLEHAPGCMLRLGVGHGDRPRPGLHHARFDLDERALPLGSRILARGVVEVAEDLVAATHARTRASSAADL